MTCNNSMHLCCKNMYPVVWKNLIVSSNQLGFFPPFELCSIGVCNFFVVAMNECTLVVTCTLIKATSIIINWEDGGQHLLSNKCDHCSSHCN